MRRRGNQGCQVCITISPPIAIMEKMAIKISPKSYNSIKAAQFCGKKRRLGNTGGKLMRGTKPGLLKVYI